MGIDDIIRALLREELRPLQEQIALLTAAAARAHRPTGDDLASVKEAARIASVSVGTVRAWIRASKLRRHGSGRLLRVRRADLLALLSAAHDQAGTHASADEQAARILGRQCARSTP